MERTNICPRRDSRLGCPRECSFVARAPPPAWLRNYALSPVILEVALSCSRETPTSFSLPLENYLKDRISAAMSAQPNAVARKATPYMVLYCLTPPQFHRYSSLTLCPPPPAWGENDVEKWSKRDRRMHRIDERNPVGKHAWPSPPRSHAKPNDRPLATEHWPLFLRSSRCSN